MDLRFSAPDGMVKGMLRVYSPGAILSSSNEIARKQFGDMVPYRAYWALKTAQNDVATWAPSGSDTLQKIGK